MPLLPMIPASLPAPREPVPYALASLKQVPVPSPVGQPQWGFKGGYAEVDTPCFLLGTDVTVPVSVGIRLFALRGDGDYWRHLNSGSSTAGQALSLCGIIGPKAGYFGAGITDATRSGGSSGPSGAGLKLIYGSQFA